MLHAITLLAVLLFAAPLAKFIPLSVLSAILLVTAYNMGEWGEIPLLLKLSKADISVLLVTIAVEVGMILAALMFIRKVTVTTTVTSEYVDDGRVHILQDKDIPEYVTIFRIHGPFLFGATDKIEEITGWVNDLPPVVVLRLRNMTAIDATGMVALEELADKLNAAGRALILCGAGRIRAARRAREYLPEYRGGAGAGTNCSCGDGRSTRFLSAAGITCDIHR
ncbi:MAG: SulP family inorganic anion transporter [Bryobacterales bacterium]|nr:SulP family inorganic anion transporter [Bryobacterales bacterium]